MLSITKLTEDREEIEDLKKEMRERRAEESTKAFQLAPLPYREVALEPNLSPEQIDAHYNRHHRGYVDRVNAARAGNDFVTYSPSGGLSMNIDEPSLMPG